MQITKDTPTAVAKFGDYSVRLPTPFTAGHVCTPGEATALNQTLRENVLNNLRKTVNAGKDENGTPFDVNEVQAMIDEAIADYEFGGSGARVSDPITKEALAVIESLIRQQNAEKGVKATAKDVSEAAKKAYNENAELAQKVRDIAEKALSARSKSVEKLAIAV